MAGPPRIQEIGLPDAPPRARQAHKGSFGRVLLIGGSVGMSGAISLSSVAALRSGVGLATAAVPQLIQSVVASYNPSFMTVGLTCGVDGQLADVNADELTALTANMSAIGIGPGLGRSAAASRLVAALLNDSPCPLVLDADAINIVAQSDWLHTASGTQPIVMTPHPGEFARLTGLSVNEIENDRERAAVEFARTHHRDDRPLVLVLKGARTLVTNGQQIFRNSTGNSGMATGGTGDVLTGIITALLGQGMLPLQAAALAVYVHGLAGDLAAEELSQTGMISSDLLAALPNVWRQLERIA